MTTTATTAAHIVAIAFALSAVGCSNTAPAPASCVDLAADVVQVQVRNPGPGPLKLPESRPDVGCCNRAGLTIGITDASGRDLDRCGFADNYDEPRLVDVSEGEVIEYRFGAKALSKMYCEVDLRRAYVTAHDGGRSLGTHPLVPCGGNSTRR